MLRQSSSMLSQFAYQPDSSWKFTAFLHQLKFLDETFASSIELGLFCSLSLICMPNCPTAAGHFTKTSSTTPPQCLSLRSTHGTELPRPSSGKFISIYSSIKTLKSLKYYGRYLPYRKTRPATDNVCCLCRDVLYVEGREREKSDGK